jgi:hypothetical protein
MRCEWRSRDVSIVLTRIRYGVAAGASAFADSVTSAFEGVAVSTCRSLRFGSAP